MTLSISPAESSVPWKGFEAAASVRDAATSDAHALLRQRRSVRRYEERQPADAVLERVLESVAQAPSAHNRQPWRFLLIADFALKAALANVMGERLAADRRRDGDAQADVADDVGRSFRRITGAPVVIVVAIILHDMDRYPDEARARAEWLMAVQSTAMAGQNLLLAAAAEGLGACWMCAPLFCELEVKRALSLPPDWQIQGFVTLGYPSRSAPIKPRKSPTEFVFRAAADRERQPA